MADGEWRYDVEHGVALQTPWTEYIMQVIPLKRIPDHSLIWGKKYAKGCSVCAIGYCLDISLRKFLGETTCTIMGDLG